MDAANDHAWRWHLPVLLALSLGLSWYVYSNTAAVTGDGVNFIQYARQVHGEIPDADHAKAPDPRGPVATAIVHGLCRTCPGLDTIVRREQHPGYPLLLLAIRETVGPCLAVDPVWQWIRSGQLATALAGMLLTTALYFLGRRLLGGSAAFVGCLIVTVTPRFLLARVDVLSDVTGLALLVLSAYFACRLLEGGGVWDAVACGIFGALAYLVRPEAIQVAVQASVTLIFRMARAESRRDAARQLAMLAMPLVLMCGSYMFLRGSVLTKQARVFTIEADPAFHDVGSVALPPPMLFRSSFAGADPTPVSAQGASEECEAGPIEGKARPPRRQSRWSSLLNHLPTPIVLFTTGVRRFLERWAECVGGVLIGAIALGLIAGRRDLLTRPGQRLIMAMVAVNFVLLPGVLYYKKGYIDWRHLLPVAALTACWAWPGLLTVCNAVLARVGRVVPRLATMPFASTVLAGGILAAALMPALGSTLAAPLHGDRHGFRLAGQWLYNRSGPGHHVIDPESLACFFADRDADRCWDYAHPELTDEYLDKMLLAFRPSEYLVVSDHYLREHGRPAGLPSATRLFRIMPMTSFPATLSPLDPSRVLVYRIKPADGR